MEAQKQDWREIAAEAWAMIRATEESLNRYISTVERMSQDIGLQFQETDRKFKETARRFQETDRRFKETDRRLERMFRETDEQLKKLSAMFSDQWGKLVEALVAPATTRLFQERGIRVKYTYQRVKAQLGGRTMELDVLLENEEEIVIIEVKSHLKVEDINEFLEEMEHFLEFFPQYKGYRIYGGVAGLTLSQETAKYAYRRGLFVLTAIGEGTAQILNDTTFRPRDFGLAHQESEEVSR